MANLMKTICATMVLIACTYVFETGSDDE